MLAKLLLTVLLIHPAVMGPHATPILIFTHLPPTRGELLPLTQDMRREYEGMFLTLKVPTTKIKLVDSQINTIVGNRLSYETVEARTNVPWFVVGVIHTMECGANFDCHLHNGDPLTAKTKNVPKGRPDGVPPFTWEDSAVDALLYMELDKWTDWSIGGTLYKLETYNGFGYRKKNVPSPYLWGGSYFYKRGKFIRDGVWSPIASSKQIGGAVLLRRMVTREVLPPVELTFKKE